ncbi:MAG TPA: NAD(P)-dependent oxidoreductase [Streptosporangiaceae bacterium]|nr:NAD(P)-dependent oxidoreductase [Streptosporangiaceae bacterium]
MSEQPTGALPAVERSARERSARGLPAVAVIGTGRMGAAMVGRLRSAGAEVVVYNRTASRAQEVAAATGATVAASAAEAASAAPVVLVSLADDQAVMAAYGGPEGIAAGVSARTVVADTSTVDPRTVARAAELLAGRGGRLLDTPVSGSVPAVQQGTLIVLAGGEAADLEQARPVLDVLARQIFHLGHSGAGAVMKLAVNTLVHALNQALSEALVLAEKAGIDRGLAYDVITASAAGAPFVQYKRTHFEYPEQAPVAFTLELVAKDLALALALAERVGVGLPQAQVNHETASQAIRAGLGQRDMAELATLIRGSGLAIPDSGQSSSR